MATTPAPTPSGTYAFSNIAPSTTNLTQGDMPIYVKPGPSNSVYAATDQPTISAGNQANIPLIGWSYQSPLGGTGLGGLKTLAQYGTQGGINYYSPNAILQTFGQLDPQQRAQIQKQLLAAGMYSSAAYYPSASGPARQQPAYGGLDMDTIQALSNAVNAAMQTGQTLDTILSQPNAAAQAASQVWQQNTMVGTFDQSDPAELRAIADSTAQSVLGRKATADEKALAVSMVQAAQVAYQRGKFEQGVAAQRSDVATQLAGGIGGAIGGVAGGAVAGGGAPATVNALLSALGGQESGSPTAGGYTAVNPQSGATGRFQIMPANWSSWAAAAGLGADAPMTPQNQEIVARNQVSLYLQDGGGDPAYVAVAWYAGEATAKAFAADPTNPKWQRPQVVKGVTYPSIASYAQSIVSKMAAAVPGGLTMKTQAAGGGPGGPSLAGEVGSINVGQRIPTTGVSLGGEVGSIGVTPGAPGASGLTGTTTTQTGTTQGNLPTPAQLVPTSEGVYTQVNPQADIAEQLRQANPLGAGSRDIANVLDAVRQLLHG